MKLLRKLGERAAGKYKRRERVYAPVAGRLILDALNAGGFGDYRMDEYLRYWLPILKNQKRAGDLTFFVGSKLARILLGLKKEDVEPPQLEHFEKIRPWFDYNADVFDFGGVRLVMPETPQETEIFASVFADILLPDMLGQEWENISRGISSEGDYEYGDDVRLNPGDVVFDCGANMGMFSALAGKRGCRVHAFEPSQYIRDTYLGQNAALNGDITIHPYALSDKRETLRFFLDRENIGSSLRADDAKAAHLAAAAPEDFETVEAVSLDEFVEENGIEKVDFIKADIEGSERMMLCGARAVLKKHAPKLSICTYHLPDDPVVLEGLIREAQPRYRIVQGDHKLYAFV